MADNPRYGRPNAEMLRTWINRPADEDGPFWALNLMKYRPVADYADGTTGVSGKEADDKYAPTDVMRDLGAMFTFLGDVVDQSGAEPRWDRIGIVRYPTRASFMAMQRRKDFQEKHVHKDAGMEFTIIVACQPEGAPTAPTPDGTMVLRVSRVVERLLGDNGEDAALPAVDGATRIATFSVEGTIIGDDRRWTHAAFDIAPTDDVVAALVKSADAVEEQFTIVVDPKMDALAKSIETAR